MIQIFLILFVAAFGEEIYHDEPYSCPEGTILDRGGICLGIDDGCTGDPYEYECGFEFKPKKDNLGEILFALVILAISVTFIISLIIWMKKK